MLINCVYNGVVKNTYKGNYSSYTNMPEAGGIAGGNRGMIDGCIFIGDVEAEGDRFPKVGGIVGVMDGGYCSNDYSIGTVRGIGKNCEGRTGGIIGEYAGSSSIAGLRHCLNQSSVSTQGFTSNNFWGGIAGLYINYTQSNGPDYYTIKCYDVLAHDKSFYKSNNSSINSVVAMNTCKPGSVDLDWIVSQTEMEDMVIKDRTGKSIIVPKWFGEIKDKFFR